MPHRPPKKRERAFQAYRPGKVQRNSQPVALGRVTAKQGNRARAPEDMNAHKRAKGEVLWQPKEE